MKVLGSRTSSSSPSDDSSTKTQRSSSGDEDISRLRGGGEGQGSGNDGDGNSGTKTGTHSRPTDVGLDVVPPVSERVRTPDQSRVPNVSNDTSDSGSDASVTQPDRTQPGGNNQTGTESNVTDSPRSNDTTDDVTDGVPPRDVSQTHDSTAPASTFVTADTSHAGRVPDRTPFNSPLLSTFDPDWNWSQSLAHGNQRIRMSIKKGIKKDKMVQLIGFGTFKVTERKARMGINPKTGEKMKIKKSKSVKFSPSSDMKGRL